MQPSAGLLFALGFSFCLIANAGPLVGRDVFLQNGKNAIALNTKFETLGSSSSCETNEIACVNDHLARCVDGHFVLAPCNAGLVCRASPNRGSPGTTIDCTTKYDNRRHILATRATLAVDPSDPSQSSLTLDLAVHSLGFQNTGQGNITSPGQVASLISSNNWINFCKTVNKPLTNGLQIPGGSCNTAPIGVIPSKENMPSSKFIFPPNFAALAKGQEFTVQLAISHLDTGWFTNPTYTYMSAPQEVNANGDVIGHSHIVIEKLTGFGQTTPMDPTKFAFFKGLNDPAVNGVLSVNVTAGLPAGYYRISAIHTAMNHQPIALPVAQRGASGDMVYFSVI